MKARARPGPYSPAATTQLLAAACLLAILPALAIFVVLQRYILTALTAGTVKE